MICKIAAILSRGGRIGVFVFWDVAAILFREEMS